MQALQQAMDNPDFREFADKVRPAVRHSVQWVHTTVGECMQGAPCMSGEKRMIRNMRTLLAVRLALKMPNLCAQGKALGSLCCQDLL